MKSDTTIRQGLAVGGLVLAVCTAAWSADRIRLGRRYSDALRGYSLRPPADTQRLKKSSHSLLATWRKRDPKTGAILWTFTVQRGVARKKDLDLKTYARQLIARLRRDKFAVQTNTLITTAGKPTLDIRGQQTVDVPGRRKRLATLWQRQVWILAGPGRFLILTISGQVDRKARLVRISNAVLATVLLNDPEEARKLRKAAVQRGKELFKTLNTAKLVARVDSQPRWYLCSLNGKPVGFMKVLERPARRNGADGVEVIKWMMWKLPKDDVRLVKFVQFATADRKVERWSEHMQTGDARRGIWRVEKGVKQGDMLLCSVVNSGPQQSRKRRVPVEIYLPRALGDLLGRIVDRTKPGSYLFAAYATGINAFEMRTFSIVGPERLELAGKTHAAVKAHDQLSENERPATLWLDAKGYLLRMETEEGLRMDRAGHVAVLRRYPKIESLLKGLDKFAKGD